MTVPCPSDPKCDAPWTLPGELAGHLTSDHLWSAQKALAESRALFGVTPAPAEPPPAAAASEPFDLAAHRRAQKPPRPHAPKESDQPSASKEESLPSKKGQYQPPMAERTCGACGDKGHRSDHCPHRASAGARDGKPAPAKAAPTCGYCHHPGGGHSKGCKRGGCKICARSTSGKCGWHSGEGGTPGPKGLRVHTKGKVTVAVSDQYLTRLKAAIAEHERKAAALREALAVLEG